VDVISYLGAAHQWDGGQPRHSIGRLLNRCRLSVQEDGGVRDLRTGLPMSGPILRRAILALCVDDEPYMIGADEAVRARSNRDLGHFLDPIFRVVNAAPGARPAALHRPQRGAGE
jgi:hypothetical protein